MSRTIVALALCVAILASQVDAEYRLIFLSCEKKDDKPSFYLYKAKGYAWVDFNKECTEFDIQGKSSKGETHTSHDLIHKLDGQGIGDWTSNAVACEKGGIISIKDHKDVVKYQVR